MKTPRISIIIITWNSAKKLAKCLQYIENQNYPKTCLEIIVVDGGSNDATFDVVLDFKKKSPDTVLIKTNIRFSRSRILFSCCCNCSSISPL